MARFNGFAAAVVVMAMLSAAAVSAQDFGMAPAPSPSMDTGAAFSMGVSGAVICSSLFLSVLALLKH